MRNLLRKHAEETASLLPALMIRAERAAASVFSGEHAQRKSGTGEKFWQFREYNSTDRPQDIDWRQSGKTDRVFIRQKEKQIPQTALLWCGAGEGMKFSSSPRHPSKLEAARIITLALAILMTRGGERVGILGLPQTGRSGAALENIGNILINESDENPLPLTGPGRSQRNSALFLTGDFLSPPEETEQVLRNLAPQSSGGFLIQTLDPAELDLPFQGRALFSHQNEREHILNVPGIREKYKERMQNHINAVESIARSNGFQYILHRTETSPEQTLLKIWTSLHERGRR